MKYFIVSDIHSFATELKHALKSAGFDKGNKNHTLIVVGDVFDRGDKTVELYKFLSSIPKKRCILIRGNHEYLAFDLIKKQYPESHDFSNHTVDTFCHIAHRDISDLYNGDVSWKEITDYVRSSKIWKWLNSKQWVDYYELGPYIFTHSFIPVMAKEEYRKYYYYMGAYNMSAECCEYNPDWRIAGNYDFEESTWGDPIAYYKAGLFEEEAKKGKILVVGHWHVSDFWWRLAHIKSYEAPISDIYYSEHLIGLDCGVFRKSGGGYYHPQNVLVIDDKDFSSCYDQHRHKLEFVKPVRIIETVTVGEKND